MFDEQTLSPLETIQDFIRYGVSCFNKAGLYFGHGTDNALDEAVHLVLGTLNLPWDTDRSLLSSRLTHAEKLQLGNALRQRVEERMPVAYILGEAWFMGLPFVINQNVLIPRSPLAEMLSDGLEPWIEGREPSRILDLCCGSGCIGIAAAYVFEDAEVVLTDISADALDVAKRNIDRHQLQDRVAAIESDLFDEVEGLFDVILTNPPYVDEPDMDSLPAEFLHEPRLGLESGQDGLDATRRILALSPDFLTEDGVLVCEVGNSIDALYQQFPEVMFVCPEFEQGGHGVFVISRSELIEHRELFLRAAGIEG